MPSAGVACAFERHMLGQLVRPDYGGPFDPSSLTEDYEAGLQIAHRGGRGVFVRMRDRTGTLVATCEYFPNRIDAPVKQKARWMVGISLAGWDRMGWHGGPAEWWMRIRDRRATLAALVLFAAYITFFLTSLIALVAFLTPLRLLPFSPIVTSLIWFNSALLVWRIAMRALFVGRAYGWRHGLTSIPRTLLANFITIMAAQRALILYAGSLLGKPLVWDKTQHSFPDLKTEP